MLNHSFMFLDTDFEDISQFCMRMEKNIVEGDGVDAVIWAGKIAERVTNYICKFIKINLNELDQNKKLYALYSEEIIPEDIYNKLNSIRQFRNIATHHELRNEMNIAKNVHRDIFTILCWFYGTYKGDESYFKLKYPGIVFRHDEDFLKKIKNNIDANRTGSNDSNGVSNEVLYQHYADYSINQYFNQENVYFNDDLEKYTAFFTFNDKKITIGHFKTKEVAVRKGYKFVLSDDFKMFINFNGPVRPEKLPDGRYSKSRGIDFDEEENLWKASFDNRHLGYFISENSAIIARKEYIDTLPLPQPKNGSYSDYKEISFDKNHKLWYIKKDGEIFDYYDSEEEAIYNLSEVLNLDIDLEDLGIVENKTDSSWRIYYRNRYVATAYSREEAISKRLEYISSFAQPKRNRDGAYSIHRGIYFDNKNLIWALKIKGELLGYFDTEEDAFNHKKEFLKSKGFDVSNLIFHEEESFDDSFDFKVNINSEENAIVYDESEDKWIVHFRGFEIGRADSETEAKKLRLKHLKSMPYPPRKSNNRYSFTEGIDYDINRHLWQAFIRDESIGYFDSEEDAFYGLKEALIKEGVDVRDMHFINSDSFEEQSDDNDLADASDSINDDNSDLNNESIDINNKINQDSDEVSKEVSTDKFKDSSNEDYNKSSKEGSTNIKNYYDVFKMNTDNYILNENLNQDTNSNQVEESLEDTDDSNIEDNNSNPNNDINEAIEENSFIEEYKKSSFYGIANKGNENYESQDISISDLESMDEDEEFMEKLDLEGLDLDKNNGFLNITDNLFNKSNRKDLKEIKLNSYDSNNFRKEITISYNDSDLCISLDGMLNRDELKNILALDLLDNLMELNYSREDYEYFSISLRLHYKLDSIGLAYMINLLSNLGWEFDLFDRLNSQKTDDSLSKVKSHSDSNNAVDNSDSKAGSFFDNLDLNTKDEKRLDFKLISKDDDSKEISSDSKEKLSRKAVETKSSNSKDYLDTNPISKRKVYPKQESISSKKKRSKFSSTSGKAIIRGGVRVSPEEANQLDNLEETKKIKSNIVNKKPEQVKEFKTTSLNDILERNRSKEEKDNENLIQDTDGSEEFRDFGDTYSEDYISESSFNDDFDSSLIMDNDDNENIDSIEYGDIFEEDSYGSNSTIEDIFDDDIGSSSDDGLFNEDDSSFEEELNNLSSNLDEESDINNSDDEPDILSSDSLDEDSNRVPDDDLNKESNMVSANPDENKDMDSSSKGKSFRTIIDSIKSNEKPKVSPNELSSDLEENMAEINSVIESISKDNGRLDVVSDEDGSDLDDISNEELSQKASKKSKPKVKKVKKPKIIPKDAFDEKYAGSIEIEYDEENDRWLAYLGGELIKSYSTPKEAYIERKKLLRRKVRRPRAGLNGKITDFEGVGFDFKEGLWYSSVNDIIINYSVSEKDAFIKRRIFVDLILDRFGTTEDEFNEEIFEKIKETSFEDIIKDMDDEDLKDMADLSLKEVKKELNKF